MSEVRESLSPGSESHIPPQPASPEMRLACMGSVACSRVCRHLNPDAQTTDAANGLPLEQSCDTISNLPYYFQDKSPTEIAASANELKQILAIPIIAGLEHGQAEDEARTMLLQLNSLRNSFDDLLVAKLKSQSTPRFIVLAKEKEYEEAQASVCADLTKDPSEDSSEEELSKDEIVIKQLLRDQARGFYDNRTLQREGLLFDTYAQQVMIKMAETMSFGYHVGLSGEPGIAKTNIAKHIARLNTLANRDVDDCRDTEPILLNFSSTSESELLITEQTLEDGTLGKELGDIARAMEEGLGIVLDEYNGLTADQQILLNDLLLKKPGSLVKIAGKEITIAKGFSVIATINPLTDTQGNRRQGRQQQDSAGAARFKRIDVHYPGSTAYQNAGGNAKESLSRIFMAQWVNHYGWQGIWNHDNESTSPSNLEVREKVVGFIAELAERATSPAQESSSMLSVGSAVPIIAECITPRDFYRLLEPVFAFNTDPSAKVIEAIIEKTDQISNSNNGHVLSTTAKQVIEELKTRHL